jgi:3-keto-disaccharide hydrolase
VTLFDGKTLDHFDKVGNANWRIEDGVVVADKGNGFLLTKETDGDFQLRAEFRVGEEANSGIFIRTIDSKTIDSKTAYEVNIWDDRPEKDYATGAIVGIAKVDPMPKTVGKWSV